MGREFELKYRADQAQIAAIREKYGSFSSISMETTYYDTPAGDLRALHWTLRHRMENGVGVCTLKTPLPDGSRGEWETESPSIDEALETLCKLSKNDALARLVRGGLVPSCGARFTRLAKTLDAETFCVELALDQGVLLGGGRELAFAEVEVELKAGRDADAVRFAGALAQTFGLIPEPKSKLQRALELG